MGDTNHAFVKDIPSRKIIKQSTRLHPVLKKGDEGEVAKWLVVPKNQGNVQ